MAGNCSRLARDINVQSGNFGHWLETARGLFRQWKYNEAFDLYELLVDAFPDRSVDLLAEVYDCYQVMPLRDRYSLYQSRRFDFNIKTTDKVLDVGSGHDPFPLATHLVELAVNDNHYGRAGLPFKHVEGKPVSECSVEDMPFSDGEFDFVYCSHVLEHANDPAKACRELMRIAKRGYIETPTGAKDLWLNTADVSNHRWTVEYENNALVFTEYTPDEIKGLRCDILLKMHCDPETKREKAFSALIYLKPEKINTMFLWEDKFEFRVRRSAEHFHISGECPVKKEDSGIEKAASLNREGEELFGKGDIKGALNAFMRAAQADPRFATAYNNIGVVYLEQGDFPKSIDYFTKALSLCPDDKDTVMNCGKILAASGNTGDARNLYASYLKRHEGDEEILHAINELQDPEVRQDRRRLRFLQINTFYDKYLNTFYTGSPGLADRPFNEQVDAVLSGGFSAVHNFTPYISALGYDSQFIIANCRQAQFQWLKEHGLSHPADADWVVEITKRQIEEFRPDVLMMSDSVLFDSSFIRNLSYKPPLVMGWIGEPMPPGIDWSAYDVILSNFSRSRQKALGFGAKATEDFHPGFVKWLAEKSEGQSLEYDVVFVGQWSELHHHRNKFITALAREAVQKGGFTLGLYLSGDQDSMPPEVRACLAGERFGLEMHRALRSGRITINAGILPEAGNMRLFEAAGTGVFLLTEYQPNIRKYFIPGEEVETFRSENELIEKIRYYISHPAERTEIARRGQERCFRDHSMEKRMTELDSIIRKHLRMESTENEKRKEQGIQGTGHSTNTEVIAASEDLLSVKERALQKRFGYYEVTFLGMRVYCRDLLSFYMAAKDIFLNRIYEFETSNPRPIVIDGGGHIGLFTLFMKKKYPEAMITVFEPDSMSAGLLRKNIEANHIKDVKIINAGLYKNSGKMSFTSDNSDGSSFYAEGKNAEIEVVTLSGYIDKEVDFMKLNIEGAELDVLTEIEDRLPMVKELVIEYHGFPETGQNLHKILSILDRRGFRYLIHDMDAETNPATKPVFKLDKDSRFFLLIYAKRLYADIDASGSDVGEKLNGINTEPVSRVFGFDRGTPIDRYYIEKFIEKNMHCISGRVLEIGDNHYTKKYGTSVYRSDVLNAVPSPEATIVGDLAFGMNIPEAAFDCIILTQTIQCIYDVKSALNNAAKALKPGGTLLLTASGISQISRYDMDRWGEYWRFTDRSLKMLLHESFPEDAVHVESFGNVAVAKSFLDGLALEELEKEILDHSDIDYQVILTAVARKPQIKHHDIELKGTRGQILFRTPTVLLYHRIADDPLDAQMLAVSPENFEAHLRLLTAQCRVLPLWELLEEVERGVSAPNSVALTFDDGYLDVLENAVPLLEKYMAHATVFVTSGMVGSDREFWWDELERIFLAGGLLPESIDINFADEAIKLSLNTPRERLRAHDEIASILRTARPEEIDMFVGQLFTGLGLDRSGRATHRIMSREQLLEMSYSPYIEIGSHTVTHPLLSALSKEQQRHEIAGSKDQVEEIIHREVRLFSYPFGSDDSFNSESKKLVSDAGYAAGIANIQGSISLPLDAYAVPRVLVRDWNENEFSGWLEDDDKGRLAHETMMKRKAKIINCLDSVCRT
ncbi:MAG: FkbM family methyltransferase [Nitrospirota bacterium]